MKVRLAIVGVAIVVLAMGALSAQTGADLFQQGLAKERGEGNLDEAIQLCERAIRATSTSSSSIRPLAR